MKTNMHITKESGNIGERIAVEYLEKNNYKIIRRNFYCKQGEIDIIAKDEKEIDFGSLIGLHGIGRSGAECKGGRA